MRLCFKSGFVALGLITMAASNGSAGFILVNGDFESAPILGLGQSGVPIGQRKLTNPADANAISGVVGWSSVSPSDSGLARLNGYFGLPASGQSAFINNWNRLMSQTVSGPINVGDTITASIDFGTLGTATDPGRAGQFYLVAGEANPTNLDQFSPRSIVLGEITIANPQWTLSTPDVTVVDDQYKLLTLSYTYQAGDPALGLPVTVAFRTVSRSYGPTYWDNASLAIQSSSAVPAPPSFLLAGIGVVCLIGCAWRRKVPAIQS